MVDFSSLRSNIDRGQLALTEMTEFDRTTHVERCPKCDFNGMTTYQIETNPSHTKSKITCPDCGFSLVGNCKKTPLVQRWNKKKRRVIKSTKLQWISCADRLPGSETPVLVLCSGNLMIAEIRWEISDYYDSTPSFRYWDDSNNDGQDIDWWSVTHWTEIPEVEYK